MNKPATYGLTHIAVSVKDLNRTKKFYQTVFDMEVMYDETDFIQLTTPGSKDIVVFEKAKSRKTGESGGIVHFGFRLREAGDIQFVIDKIKKAGGKIIDQGEFLPGSPYVFFHDPDGYEVEVWYELLPPRK